MYYHTGNRRVVFFIVAVINVLVSMAAAMEVVSPDTHIKVTIKTQPASAVQFKIECTADKRAVEIIPFSPLGLKTNTQDFSALDLVSESNITLVHDSYDMPAGKRKHCENVGAEKTFRFRNASGQCIDMVFRAYNNGVAFRYVLPEYSDTLQSITDELTTYALPKGIKRWVQSYPNAYEAFYPADTDGKANQSWSYPALFNIDKDIYILITEADISAANYAGSLCTSDNPQLYKVNLAAGKDNRFVTPWQSSWRVLMIGKLSDIVESTLVTDVSTPCKLPEIDWIKPGPVSWIYWAANHGSKDYQQLVKYVDLAADMGWPYTLIDWEWDQMGNGGTIKDIVKYANSKGVKPLMWYNSGTAWMGPTPNDRMNTAEKRAKEFAWLNEKGVYGIKVDFFAGDQQKTMSYYIRILEDAAKYKLMVNFHGSTLPRGWNRTYPNLMTMEGVYGAEWYNNAPVLTQKAAVHNATLPFTRNVVGPMDYTPVTFTDSQHKHITSYGHELALSVLFESGFQHFADRPSGYYNLPDEPKQFLKTVPAAWDDTKLIDGYPGEQVVMARKKGQTWYLGGINGTDEAKTLTVTFDFLDKETCQLTLIQDGADDKSFETKQMTVTKGQKIEVPCLPRGGFVGTLQ